MADVNPVESFVDSPKQEILGSAYLCSCCLATGNLRNMLHKIENGGKMENYYEMMWNCYDSQILCTDNPTNEYYICDKCITRLTDSYLFKLQVIEAQRTLQDLPREQENAQGILSKKHLEPINFFSMDESVVKIECQGDIECNDNGDIFKNEGDLTYYQPNVSANKTSSKSKRAKTTMDTLKLPATRSNPPESEASQLHYLLTRAAAESATPEKPPSKRNRKDRSESRETKKNPPGDVKSKIGIEVKSAGYRFKCNQCSKEFKYRGGLKNHLKQQHNEHRCPKCGKMFNLRSKFLKHAYGHKAHTHSCRHCRLIFQSYWLRQRHLIEVHGERSFVCDYCAATCLSLGMLNKHVKEKHLPPMAVFKCDNCPRQYFKKGKLARHMITHLGRRDHKCDVCLKTFARSKTLKQHRRIHDDVRNHACKICGLRFVQKASLNWHLKKQH